MRVKLLDQAKADLVELNQYYRTVGGTPLARKMLARIKEPILALKDHPGIAPPYELAPNIQRLVVADGTFLAFYRVDNDVEVLHIRRAERAPVTAAELEPNPHGNHS
ncbi:MAG: type II toxin-antitoxin system RelE/ParE family toxin [Sulfuricella sp.]|nr:type II toxin-antitoxin system RelE/ParE family toxin [Sulfuricella sp.]